MILYLAHGFKRQEVIQTTCYVVRTEYEVVNLFTDIKKEKDHAMQVMALVVA